MTGRGGAGRGGVRCWAAVWALLLCEAGRHAMIFSGWGRAYGPSPCSAYISYLTSYARLLDILHTWTAYCAFGLFYSFAVSDTGEGPCLSNTHNPEHGPAWPDAAQASISACTYECQSQPDKCSDFSTSHGVTCG
ncbi:hypothetical protein C2E23DRAFT_161387 [Lenzites betulinus]|nr:hypothetical protein C2E23DRAFT_161387 [Lenzites betulinus]